MRDRQQEWQELYKRTLTEKDPKKLRQLTARMNQLLKEKELRLMGELDEPKGAKVFQIAYDEALLITREQLLKRRGYEVTSALGNDDAKRLLNNGREYAVFIIGHAGQWHCREEVAKWLKTNFPDAKIIALNPHSDSTLRGADYNFILNGPEEWLAAVAAVAR